MKPIQYIVLALFMLVVLTARAGDIRMGITPNPANNQTTVTIEGSNAGALLHPEVYTVLGEKVASAQWRHEGNTFILNTSGVPDGIYLVKYGNGDQAIVKRLKIQHQ